MKGLTQSLKRALAALAAADAGEMLGRRDMYRHLDDLPRSAPTRVLQHKTDGQRRIALWLSQTCDQTALDYAISSCRRLHAGLDILVPHAQVCGGEAARTALAKAEMPWQVVVVDGAPESALPHYLHRHHQIIFLVCAGDDPTTAGIARGRRPGRNNLGVPLVVVTAPQHPELDLAHAERVAV